MLRSLTQESFSPHVGSIFVAHFGEDGFYPLALETIKTKPRGGAPENYRDPFSLFFSGPGPDYLLQGCYRITHDAMGEMEIFIVPVGEQGGGFIYQAAFT